LKGLPKIIHEVTADISGDFTGFDWAMAITSPNQSAV
jgi:hypothetical protein